MEPLPPTIQKIYDFLEKWPRADYGPAHITLSDHNLEDHNLRFCLNEIAKANGDIYDGQQRDRGEIAATKAFLEELLAMSEEDRFEGMEDW